jgi:hypothetical protein
VLGKRHDHIDPGNRLQQRPVQPYRKNKSHPHDRVLNLLQHLGNYLRLRRTPVKQFRALTQSHYGASISHAKPLG